VAVHAAARKDSIRTLGSRRGGAEGGTFRRGIQTPGVTGTAPTPRLAEGCGQSTGTWRQEGHPTPHNPPHSPTVVDSLRTLSSVGGSAFPPPCSCAGHKGASLRVAWQAVGMWGCLPHLAVKSRCRPLLPLVVQPFSFWTSWQLKHSTKQFELNFNLDFLFNQPCIVIKRLKE
jgi:hypothetical protein